MPLSSDSFIGDGTTVTFPVTFPFLDRSHVIVTLDDVVQVRPTSYDFVTDTSIDFVTAPGSGVVILFKRITPGVARLVDFTTGAQLTEADLDTSFLQTFFLLQERVDSDVRKLGLNASETDWNAENKKIENLAAGTNPLDAVNLAQFATIDASGDADRAEAARDAAEAFVDSLNAPIQRLDKKLGDGVWTTMDLTDTPLALPNMILIKGGVIQESGVDYTVSGTVVTLVGAPSTNGILYQAWYGQTIQLTKLQEATVTKSQLTFNPVEDIGRMPTMEQGLAANRPAFGNPDAIYLSTDTLVIERDTGTAWVAYSPIPSDVVTLSNDGVGSGVDTDLIRGLAGVFTNDLSNPGFQKLPGGLIIQWGTTTVSANSNLAITLPIPYPNAHLLAMASMPSQAESGFSFEFPQYDNGADELSTTQIRVTNMNQAALNMRWLSLGH